MTQRQFAALAVRLLALYCFVAALSNLQMAFIAFGYYLGLIDPARGVSDSYFYNLWSVIIAAFPAMLNIGFGVLLWVFADGVAMLISRDEDETSNVFVALDSFAVHVIAFSIVGLVLISNALPVAFQLVSEAFVASRSAYPPGWTNLESPQIFTALTQAILGIGLIFGGKGIVKIIRSARDIGRDPSL